jgi:hypothetical protein
MYFHDVTNLSDLRKRYISLSLVYHPDRGGSTRHMQAINEEYHRRKQNLVSEQEGLRSLNHGDTVFVNGTECMVVSLSETTFEAQAKGRDRRAIFDRYTGRCITDRKFKAYVIPTH